MANSWGESGSTWGQCDWGQQDVFTIHPSGYSITAALGDVLSYNETGWGSDAWGVENWGETATTVVPTGQSITSSVGSPTITAEINTGWGQDGWGVENWGESGQTVVIVSGVEATTGIGEDVSWGKQTWGSATTGWGGEYFLVPEDIMGLTGLGGRISPFLFGAQGIGGPAHGASKGLLGKLGLTKGWGAKMPTALGGITAASLMTYFMQKGKTEEEAEQLAQDVYRGKGLGLDLIKADIKKYRTGALSGSQMFDKGYHFLTPRNYIGAKGGRVKYAEGPKKMNQDGLEFIVPVGQSEEKAFYDAIINDVEGIMSDERKDEWLRLLVPQLIESGEMSREEKKELGFAQGGRIGKLGGGLPRIPMGMPRVNAGGIRELDYRQSGGFVPMGVKEKADDVPAMLSKNEFVMTADAVRGAGGGSVEKGAQRMYDTMKRLEGKIA